MPTPPPPLSLGDVDAEWPDLTPPRGSASAGEASALVRSPRGGPRDGSDRGSDRSQRGGVRGDREAVPAPQGRGESRLMQMLSPRLAAAAMAARDGCFGGGGTRGSSSEEGASCLDDSPRAPGSRSARMPSARRYEDEQYSARGQGVGDGDGTDGGDEAGGGGQAKGASCRERLQAKLERRRVRRHDGAHIKGIWPPESSCSCNAADPAAGDDGSSNPKRRAVSGGDDGGALDMLDESAEHPAGARPGTAAVAAAGAPDVGAPWPGLFLKMLDSTLEAAGAPATPFTPHEYASDASGLHSGGSTAARNTARSGASGNPCPPQICTGSPHVAAPTGTRSALAAQAGWLQAQVDSSNESSPSHDRAGEGGGSSTGALEPTGVDVQTSTAARAVLALQSLRRSGQQTACDSPTPTTRLDDASPLSRPPPASYSKSVWARAIKRPYPMSSIRFAHAPHCSPALPHRLSQVAHH